MTKTCLTMCIVLFCAICSATPFLTGAYVQYDLSAGGVANIGTLKTKLLQGRYNAVTLPVYHSDLNGLESALGTLGSDVKTILEDRYWDRQSGKVGINFLSWGNYLKMEAEYMYKYIDDIVPPDDTLFTFIVDDLTTVEDTGVGDVYNYVFAHENHCGERVRNNAGNSNQWSWVCSEFMNNHIPGKALSNPRFRWTVPGHTYPRSIGYDLKFYPHAINNNKLYLTVAMKFDAH